MDSKKAASKKIVGEKRRKPSAAAQFQDSLEKIQKLHENLEVINYNSNELFNQF